MHGAQVQRVWLQAVTSRRKGVGRVVGHAEGHVRPRLALYGHARRQQPTGARQERSRPVLRAACWAFYLELDVLLEHLQLQAANLPDVRKHVRAEAAER